MKKLLKTEVVNKEDDYVSLQPSDSEYYGMVTRLSGYLGFELNLRIRHYITIGLMLLAFLVVIFPEWEETSHYASKGWVEMSIAVGASFLTLVGITTSIVIGNENQRRSEFSQNLIALSRKIEEKSGSNLDRSFDPLYAASGKSIRAIIDQMTPLKYSEGSLGIMSFFLFLASALAALFELHFKVVLLFFSMGLPLLVGYVVFIILEFVKIDRAYSIPQKNGALSLLAVKVEGSLQDFEKKGKKASLFLKKKKINRIEIKLRFNGRVRNGFVHARVNYSNGMFSFHPDRNTYLSNFGYADNTPIVLLEPKFDTGVLQGPHQREFSIYLVLRTSQGEEENPTVAEAQIQRRVGDVVYVTDKKRIYTHYFVKEDTYVQSIRIGVYEDPLFRSNFKRRAVDYLMIDVERSETV